jgi:excisionase family DNA binding protein
MKRPNASDADVWRTWLNVSEGAEYAGVCRDTIDTACERSELHHIRIGGRRSIRLKREWIDQWFERTPAWRVQRRPRGWPADADGAPRPAVVHASFAAQNAAITRHAANPGYNHRRTRGEWATIFMSFRTGRSFNGMRDA